VSDTDSFIDEVTEEVRRDRLFRLFRKYGWIAILAVVLLVGGAAFNEWQKARRQAAAEAFGDAVLAALREADPAARARALASVPAEGPGARAVARFLEAAELLRAGDKAAAAARLEAVASDEAAPHALRDLAALKRVAYLRDDMPTDQRLDRLDPLAAPGAPYRALALEARGMLLLELGRRDEAIASLREAMDDAAAPAGLAGRVSQVLVALGADEQAS